MSHTQVKKIMPTFLRCNFNSQNGTLKAWHKERNEPKDWQQSTGCLEGVSYIHVPNNTIGFVKKIKNNQSIKKKVLKGILLKCSVND